MREIAGADFCAWLSARAPVRRAGRVERIRLRGVAVDSRVVRPGDLFVAVRGECVDSHAYIDEARRRGAVAVLAERAVPPEMPGVLVENTRPLVGHVAGLFLGEPARNLRTVGITGTNGKTTTAQALWRMLSEDDRVTAGLLGTVENVLGGEQRTTPQTTTPGPLELHRAFAAMVRNGARSCVMEVSSHSIVQDRIAGVPFACGILTNIGSDHLDYHGTFGAYRAAKTRFFSDLAPHALAVLNAGDASCEHVAARTRARVIRYSAGGWDGLTRCVVHVEGPVRLKLADSQGEANVRTRAWGRHNAANLCAAVCCARALDIPWETISRALEGFTPPAGRLEEIPASGCRVFVDYAHTACALSCVLESMRAVRAEGRLVLVFGCGGDRDRTKRPAMGAVACVGADVVFLTSDNPRREDPQRILDDVRAGMPAAAGGVHVIEDRESAIRAAIGAARDGDVVLIAGKGHEDYQIIGTTRRHFSDREIASRAIQERADGAL